MTKPEGFATLRGPGILFPNGVWRNVENECSAAYLAQDINTAFENAVSLRVQEAVKEALEQAAVAECHYCRHPGTCGLRPAQKNKFGYWVHYLADIEGDVHFDSCKAANIRDLKAIRTPEAGK